MENIKRPDKTVLDRSLSTNLSPKQIEYQPTTYKPSNKLPPEMTYNLGRKTYKQYLKMKRDKSKPKLEKEKVDKEKKDKEKIDKEEKDKEKKSPL